MKISYMEHSSRAIKLIGTSYQFQNWAWPDVNYREKKWEDELAFECGIEKKNIQG